jgi:hypothetical protein
VRENSQVVPAHQQVRQVMTALLERGPTVLARLALLVA